MCATHKASRGDTAFCVAGPSLWNVLPQHLTLKCVTIAAFKIKLKDCYFQEVLVRGCSQRMLEQRYTSVTIMITNFANIDCFEVGRLASHFEPSKLRTLKE